MNKDNCPIEEKIIQALSNGSWNEQLEHHIQECNRCADTYISASFLNRMNQNIIVPTTLPSAEIIFAHSRLRKESARENVVFQPLKIMNWVFRVMAAVLLISFIPLGKGVFEEIVGEISINIDIYSLIQTIDVTKINPFYSVVTISILLLLTITAIILYIDHKEEFQDKHSNHIHLHTL